MLGNPHRLREPRTRAQGVTLDFCFHRGTQLRSCPPFPFLSVNRGLLLNATSAGSECQFRALVSSGVPEAPLYSETFFPVNYIASVFPCSSSGALTGLRAWMQVPKSKTTQKKTTPSNQRKIKNKTDGRLRRQACHFFFPLRAYC